MSDAKKPRQRTDVAAKQPSEVVSVTFRFRPGWGPGIDFKLQSLPDLVHYIERVFAEIERLNCLDYPMRMLTLGGPNVDPRHVLSTVAANVYRCLRNWDVRGGPDMPDLPFPNGGVAEASVTNLLFWLRCRVEEMKGKPNECEDRSATAPGEADRDKMIGLIGVVTDGVSDERIRKASTVLSDPDLSVNAKLTRIAELIPALANSPAPKLATLFGCTKQNIYDTDWWRQNRRGERLARAEGRRAAHVERNPNLQRGRVTRARRISDDDE